MPLLTVKAQSDYFQVTGSSSTTYSRFDLNWSGLPSDVTIQRCYWKFDVDRQNGGVYARWYEYGNAGNAGYTGLSGAGFTFEVGKVTGTGGTARVYLGSQNGWTKYTNISFNIEYAYKQSSLTLSAQTVEAGKAITAQIAAQSATATHTLVWKLGSNSQTQTLVAGVKSSSFTVPLAWIPNATSATATCTLTTLEGGNPVGESQTLSFTVTVNGSVVPSCTVSAALVNGFAGLYLGGRSSVKLTIGNAQAGNGASIKSYKLSGSGYSSTSQTATFGPLNAGTHTFTASVTDSRGRTGTATVSVTVQAYASPTLSGVSIYRSNSGGAASETGGYIALKATAAYTALGGKNALTLRGRYRPVGGSWSAWTAMTSGTRLLLGGALSATASYEAQIQATDTVGNTASYAAIIPTASVAFNLKEGGKGAAFGKYAEGNGLELAADWGFRRDGLSLTPAPRNLLDNGDFTNPVNQRGQSSYTGSRYTIDRWLGSQSLVSLVDGGISLALSTGSWAMLAQYVPGIVPGKTYTLAACKTDGVTAVLTFTAAVGMANQAAAFNNAQETIVARYSTTASMFYVGFSYTGATNMTVEWVALYEGEYTADTLPEYVPKGYAAELAECQRYYQSFGYNFDDISLNFTTGYPTRRTLLFPQRMRIAPTVTFVKSWSTELAAELEAGYVTQTGMTVNALATSQHAYSGWHGSIVLSADL